MEIDAASISTRDDQRDGYLRSPDFLDVEHHPTLGFRSTRIERVDSQHGRIHGNLTIQGESRDVILDAEYVGKAKCPGGTTSAGFSASTSLDRKD